MIGKACIVFALTACALATPDRSPYRPPQPQYRPPQPQYSAPSRDSRESSFEEPKYTFDWHVNEDFNNFNQQESRDGENTQGGYSVALPDGRTQKVSYYVDGESGFIAEVSYSGEARFPDSNEYRAPAQTYTTPRPAYTTPRATTPRPTYTTPRATTRRPTYTTTRRPTYTTRRPATTRRPTTRRPTYTTPRPSYTPPRNTYQAPNSLLAAYGF